MMRIAYWMTAAACAASLTGCYTYPVYQPVPVARLTPQQSAALAQQPPMSQSDRDRLAADNAQVTRDDQANSYAQANASPYGYVAPAAPVYYDYPYYGYGYGYGYPYGGYYGGFYPGITLGFGFGGYYGRGFRGGYGGYHGGGGFHHR